MLGTINQIYKSYTRVYSPKDMNLKLFILISLALISRTEQPIYAQQTSTACQNAHAITEGIVRKCLRINNFDRYYYVIRPGNTTKPLRAMMFLHGGGGNAESIANKKLHEYITKRNWVAIVPSGINRTWDSSYRPDLINNSSQGVSRAGDVAFLNAVIETEVNDGTIKRESIVMNGFSRGGLMTSRFACDSGKSLAGFALGAAQQHWENECPNPKAMPAWFFNGTEDKWMPYRGTVKRRRGVEIGIRSVDYTVNYWSSINGCTEFTTQKIDNNPSDGTLVEVRTGKNCKSSPIQQFIVQGGGHTWAAKDVDAGLGEGLVGKASREVEASDEMFTFFERYVP